MSAVDWSQAPMARAVAAARREMLDEETEREAAWLLKHPHLWLAALARMERDAAGHIAKRKARLDAIKPKPGETQNQIEYQTLKIEFGQANAGSYHFMQHVKDRIDDVKALIGTKPLAEYMTVGDLVEVFNDLGELLDREDYHRLRSRLYSLSKRFGGNLSAAAMARQEPQA